MEFQTWIIGQTVIEVIIICFMLWFLKSHLAMRKKNSDLRAAFEDPELILKEMRQLASQLDKNLEDKKDISNKMLDQLDDVLTKADHSYNQLQSVLKEYNSRPLNTSNTEQGSSRVKSSVNNLLKKGLSKEEVAQHLGISISEIDLLVKLQSSQINNHINDR